VFWESVIMNFIIKLLKFKNLTWKVRFNSILIIVNRLTKYTMFISFREIVTASILTYIILQELISNHELLKKFIINRDKLFMSKFWEMFTAELEIKHKMSMIYYLQTDEQSEWMNQTVKMYLWHYVNIKQSNWVQLLLMTQFMYNNVWNEIMRKTSFKVNYEYHSEIWRDSQVHESWSQKAMLNITELKKLHTDLIKRIEEQKKWTTEIKSFEIDKKIYLWMNNIQTKKKSKKLMNKSIESFMIKRNIKKLSYELDLL